MSKTTATADVFDQLAETEAVESAEDSELSDDGQPDDGDTSEAASDPERQAKARTRRVLPYLVRITAGIILLSVLGGAGFLGWKLKTRTDTEASGRSALEAATAYAVTLSSMDSKDIDASINAVLDGATGEFKSMYSQASAQLRQLLVDNKASSRGVVVDAAVKSSRGDEAEIMMFLDQSVSNAVNPEPRVDRLRVVMTMQRIDNRWLAKKLDIE